jgi:hypothetical protein
VDFCGGDEQCERRAGRGKFSPVWSGFCEGEHGDCMDRINASSGEHPPSAGPLYERCCLYEVPGAERAGSEEGAAVWADVAPGQGAEDRAGRDQQRKSIHGACNLGSID